jgi:hypothetical protein
VANPANLIANTQDIGTFWRFCGIGTAFELYPASAANWNWPRKGRIQMSGQSTFTRTLVAVVAAVLMSSVTVGAAVGPAQAVASPAVVSANA